MNPLSPIGVLAAATLIAGCAGNSTPAPLAPDHPANPQAAAAPMPARSTTLSLENAGVGAGASTDAPAAHQHEAEPSSSASPTTKPVAAYTCPHHPEVRQSTPGTCPKCKMKLEPEEPADAPEPAKPAESHGAHDHSQHQDHGGHNK